MLRSWGIKKETAGMNADAGHEKALEAILKSLERIEETLNEIKTNTAKPPKKDGKGRVAVYQGGPPGL